MDSTACLPRRDGDRARRSLDNALVAFLSHLGVSFILAATDVILPLNVDVGSGSADLGHRAVQSTFKRPLARLAGQVEVSGLDDAADIAGMLGESGNRQEGQDKGREKLGHVTSPFGSSATS